MSLVKNLIHNYGGFRIEIPEWNIPDQGISALWGASGAGKTSVFRLLMGLEPCPGLVWEFKGLDLANLDVPERKLGVVFQNYELFPHLSARENILFAAKARRQNPEETRTKLAGLVADLKLEDCFFRRATLLSGGEKQRVALARALIGEPRFLVLDEPFSALDAELRQEARALVKKVIKARNIPTLLVSHDEADLEGVEKIFRIEKGKLV